MLVPLYGTVQAAKCFYRTLVKRAERKGYLRSKADPCLLIVKPEGRLQLTAVWIDNLMAVGEKRDLMTLLNLNSMT